jgi:hypothetical protein
MRATDSPKMDRLYERALLIQDGKANGLWLPIIRHLALRQYPCAMVDLANWQSDNRTWASMGLATDAFSALGLYRRAYRAGNANAAQNMAMEHFNRNDLTGYRIWLRRAARGGDKDCDAELRCFETRQPYCAATRIRRLRPLRRREKFG